MSITILQTHQIPECGGELVVRIPQGLGLVPEGGFGDDVEGDFAHCEASVSRMLAGW